jgi:ABC-type uncharacterized transport system YnjBCD ATPase subunit
MADEEVGDLGIEAQVTGLTEDIKVDINTSKTTPHSSTQNDTRGVIERHVLSASVKAYVETLHPFAVTFQDLSVYVPREKGCLPGIMSSCPCLHKPLSRCMMENFGWAVEQRSPYYALQETSGYVKSGQMLLVLTPDTQYAAALIQTLTGRLSDKYSVSGSIRVNGTAIPTNVMQGWRRIAAHVSADDNTHSPVLTVRETLRFAAECTRSEAEPAEKIDDIVNEVLEILDLASVADTVVGDENLRGISGGQKRRYAMPVSFAASHHDLLALKFKTYCTDELVHASIILPV